LRSPVEDGNKMGIIQKDAIRTTIVTYLGLILGYINRGVLFVIFLTTDQIGLLSLIVSIGLLFAQFSNLGMAYSVWRFFPFFRNTEKKNHGFFQFSMLLTTIGIGACLILCILLKDVICSLYIEKSASFVHYYYWIIPIGVSYSLFMTLDNFLRSLYKNLVSVVATELVLRVIATISILLFAVDWIDFTQLLLVQSISYIFPTLLLIYQVFRNREMQWNLNDIAIPRRFKRIIFAFSLYSYLNFLGILFVISLDTMMVASMIGLKATGIFSTIIFIVSGLQVPYRSLVRISSPFVARYWKERDMIKMQEMYTRISSIGLVIGLGAFMIFWASRVEIFHFFPPEFSQGIPVFLILMIGRLVDMYCGLNGAIIVSSKKFKYDLIFTMMLCAVVFVLNLQLLPIYGMYGAAISTTVAYVLYNLARVLFVYFAFSIHPFRLRQLSVMALSVIVLFGFEFVPILGNELISFATKSVLIIILFFFPIYWFRLDHDVAGYMDKLNIIRKIRRRAEE